MTIHFQDDTATLHVGDCIDVMATMPAASVDCVVTSPPYAMQRASTYGGISEANYPQWTVSIFEQMKRILKPNGSVLWNITPHVKASQIADYVLRMRLALRDDGWKEHDELAWVKPGAMPTGHRERPVRAWESVFWYSQTLHPFADATKAGNELTQEQKEKVRRHPYAFRGRGVRLGWDHLGQGVGKTGDFSRSKNFLSLSSSGVGADIDHPAPYPVALADWLVKMFCPVGGTVLDPFSGSASTGAAASQNGCKYVGIDLDPNYHDLALRTRLRQDSLLTMEA